MRIFRLGIGIAIAFNAWQTSNGWLAVLAGIFVFQAVTNTGCCSSAECKAPDSEVLAGKDADISFTEIKQP